ncbi:MAG: UDP-N-acetylmuramoyl-tripeptide--D-alanyl-D-alanine ligase [Eubacterium sp.]|nr:UDP-N-acetylmuramoyl-tripeptide--D-alanyl-D-alanine ligase [Eubacterium sp.]
MKELLLKDIIKAINAKCDNEKDIVITGVSTDTRTIKQGDLFIALVGEKFDGHSYIDVAVKNGAAAVVCSRSVEADVPVLIVEDTLKALQGIAEYYLTTLDVKVVGVTGSNGKTTTRDMTAAVLSTKYKVYSTAKNFNNEIGLPKSVLELDDSYDIAVLEMGMNHFGEISSLTKVAKPDVAIITNIGKAHIGNLGSQENILKAKLEILEGLKKDGVLVLNGDDKFLFGAYTEGIKKHFVGVSADNLELRAVNIKSTEDKTEFSVVYDGKKYDGSIPVLGVHNVLDSLLAIYTGLRFGVDIDSAFRALGGYKSVGMRCESEAIGGITLVKDYYNSSPDSSRVALQTLGDFAKGKRKIALLGEMLELGDYSKAEHENLGKMCVKNEIDYAFFIGADFDSFKKGMPENSQAFSDNQREKMIKAVCDYYKNGNIKEGDAVLIKGSRGMKMEEVYTALKEAIEQ